ncbi:spermatogenesis-associated protein 6 isoform X2 [Oenanthe melanoleuca]|uniref:spermatogenesis-associated protein 6 isoform X2 n=1 Tax=Oenanthe melanoleuca TaxID=2939378 RepID=UPI0024C140AF|nr:spermatogenesis-associated protein 6 isoform X2 [Oenanthe melanoleuca]
MPRKALRCGLQLELRSITCPGVLLKDKQELYINVFVLGQYGKTESVPAVFPLFFQERLVFEKEFANIVDPGDLVKLLEFDTAILELIQLTPPVGKVLATYEENTRDFLFPDPKLTHGRRGLEREVLMKRSPSFTGIAPKLRFSTISIISDSLLSLGRSHIQVPDCTLNGEMQSRVPKKSPPPAEKGRQSSAVRSYEQPTIASKSRSPSPYTKRRMCELSEEARQRLAHLNLGPHEFRRDTDKPPFVIRRIGQPGPGAKLHPWCSPRESTAEAWPKAPLDSSPLDSYRPKKTETKSTSGKGLDSSAICKGDVSLDPPSRESHSAASLEHSAPPAAQEPSLSRTSLSRTSLSRTSPSSVLNRSSLRERFSTGLLSPANGDEIHKRVKNILRTHSARQRLIFDDLPQTRKPSDNVPLTMNELRSSPQVQQNAPVHLDNGECWSSPAAVYKEKPHRAVLEETFAKIYRSMHQKTAGAVSEHKTHS